ncbi:MAG: hypothetical protein JO307_28285, partial [Bryobacterales bacterium]|nr:hypothetical protein [Bryobacterales bacterium]
LESAAQICNLKEALNETWRPEKHGFEFSSRDLTAWMERRELTDQARRFEIYGRLPSTNAEPDDSSPSEST